MRFETWQKSVDYYNNWQKKRYKNKSEDYYAFLIRIKYARTNEYVKRLKSIKFRDIKLPEERK